MGAAGYEQRRDYSILFADIEGFTRLKAFQQKLFLSEVLPRLAECLHKPEHAPEQANTWGDGLMAVFPSHTHAARCALTIRDMFRVTPWEDFGLPPLRIRIALHAGEVFVGNNPVTNTTGLIGTEVNRAARIEPVVAANHVYATRDFVNRCKDKGITFQIVGNLQLPKAWGSEDLYVASWPHESLDPNEVRTSVFDIRLSDAQGVTAYFRTSKFGQRLKISDHAKTIIADYCVKSDFWNPNDVVFVESGTLPVYMAYDLFKRRDPQNRPRLLISNNLACSLIAMMGSACQDESAVYYPEDRPTDCILLGGRMLEDYAATMPEHLLDEVPRAAVDAENILSYFRAAKVSHVVMMVSKLTRQDGPCAVSTCMRRFKKVLLRYVAENDYARMSILGEADKLVGRRGWSVDDVDLSGDDAEKYWPRVLACGRLTVITATSPGMELADLGLAQRELTAMQTAGASAVLLDRSGKQMSLDEGTEAT